MQQANMETLSVSGIAHIGDEIHLVRAWEMKEQTCKKCGYFITHTFHVCYIYLHLVADFDAKCRFIFHTWMLWVIFLGKLHRDQPIPAGLENSFQYW